MYHLFVGDNYYPGGGIEDFHSSFENSTEAVDFGKDLVLNGTYDWFQLADAEMRKVVSGSRSYELSDEPNEFGRRAYNKNKPIVRLDWVFHSSSFQVVENAS